MRKSAAQKQRKAKRRGGCVRAKKEERERQQNERGPRETESSVMSEGNATRERAPPSQLFLR